MYNGIQYNEKSVIYKSKSKPKIKFWNETLRPIFNLQETKIINIYYLRLLWYVKSYLPFVQIQIKMLI